ncbi:uncharacterized protein LOC126709886 [Quercus robur]|nr:uncharacterized protein LOC126709886 [Quercus robur]
MADLITPDIETVQESTSTSRPAAKGDDTPDVQSTETKMEMMKQQSKEAYKDYENLRDDDEEEKPGNVEVVGWYMYDFCTYFIHSVLIPIVFPLIIAQTVSWPPQPVQGWDMSPRGLVCREKESKLYHGLTHRSITIINHKYSPLVWTSISWAIGLAVAAPILGSISFNLDHGDQQILIAAAATATGAIFCLPAGFFKTVWIFLPYITGIVAALSVATACHTRHLGLMLRCFTSPTHQQQQRRIPIRTAVSGWFSLYATVAGSVGSAIISAFTYYMLREPADQEFISLWIVSIFSGLIWFGGIAHVFTPKNYRTSPTPTNTAASISKPHYAFYIFHYPRAIGSLVGVFLSSFTTMSIFIGGVLFLVGQMCLKPVHLLYFWLVYFMFPLFSLPLLQPLQHLLMADAAKMQLLGFLLSTATSGAGFYFQDRNWKISTVLFFAAVQSTSTGLFHAFGRVLLLDCSPPGNEGAFSIWFSWIKAFGTFAGFAVSSSIPGKIGTAFGIAFCTAVAGIVMFIFGNFNDYGGAEAACAGHVKGGSKKGSPVLNGQNTGAETKERVLMETP